MSKIVNEHAGTNPRRKKYPDPPVALMQEYFSYNSESGEIRRIKANTKGPQTLGPVGTLSKAGYLTVAFRGKHIYLHRLAWALSTGEWPAIGIDHEDGDGSHNWLENLRPCNQSQNGANRGPSKSSTSGIKGVFYDSRSDWMSKRWFAQIMHRRKFKKLGYFATKEEAAAAYREASLRLHGEFSKFTTPAL